MKISEPLLIVHVQLDYEEWHDRRQTEQDLLQRLAWLFLPEPSAVHIYFTEHAWDKARHFFRPYRPSRKAAAKTI